jgi:hypothetical protein
MGELTDWCLWLATPWNSLPSRALRGYGNVCIWSLQHEQDSISEDHNSGLDSPLQVKKKTWPEKLTGNKELTE